MEPFTHQASGRNPRTLMALGVAWGLLAAGWWGLGIAPWILALLILPTLPALWDLVQNPSAGLAIADGVLRWHSGRRSAEIPLAEISHIRLDRRWDMTIRTTVVPHAGRPVRVPVESTPPAATLEDALTQRGIRVERHPFSLF